MRLTFFLLSLLCSCNREQPSFTTTTIEVCKSPGSIETADFNNDKLADLAITSETDSSVTILLGVGDGKFRPSPGSPFYAGSTPNDIAIVDFNKDGNLDLLVANHEKKYVTLLIGDGLGGFSPSKQSPIRTKGIPHVHGVAAADFDNDGLPDLVTDSWGNDQLEVLFGGEKEGVFFKVGKRPYQRHRVDDVNGDGFIDIVSSNMESNDVTILLSDGRRNFHQATGSPTPAGDAPFGIAVGDVNGDSKPDLAVINSPSSTSESKGVDGLTVLIGDGRGNFTKLKGSPFKAGKIPNRVAIGDVNGDNVNDIVTSDSENTEIYLFLMNNKGATISGVPVKVGRHPKGIAVADLDGDRRADIIVCNNQDNTISILTSR